jgi:hypothetical protein
MMHRNRGAAAVLPINSGEDPCCRSPDNDHDAAAACRAKDRRCRKDRRHASILGPGVSTVPAGRGAGAWRVRRHAAVRGRRHGGGVGVQDDPAEARAAAPHGTRRRGRAPGGGDDAPHVGARRRRGCGSARRARTRTGCTSSWSSSTASSRAGTTPSALPPSSLAPSSSSCRYVAN